MDWIGWLRENRAAVSWLLGISGFMFLGSLVVVPLLVVRIPTNYFSHADRPPLLWARQHFAVRAVLLLAKNVLGLALLFLGLVMLVLPGQGLLAILVGLMLLNFPGKFRFERWLIIRRPVLSSVNWIRRQADREPLAVQSEADDLHRADQSPGPD